MAESGATIGVEGADGALGRLVLAALGGDGVAVDRRVAQPPAGLQALVLATPPSAWAPHAAVPTLAPGVVPARAVVSGVDLPAAGWWGGLGTLLAATAGGLAGAPTDIHVAYGFPGGRRALARATPTVRSALLDLLTTPGGARVAGDVVDEPLAEGRRLAWFPAPVGPAHAVAVGGFEHGAPLVAPTVRTWVAAGSLGAELLQAAGRLDATGRLGRLLARRARDGGAGPGGTGEVRWAVVVEARARDGAVVRAWANGTDPVAAAAVLLAQTARRVAGAGAPLVTGTVLDLAAPEVQLDDLADAGVLRWSVSRPTPSRR